MLPVFFCAENAKWPRWEMQRRSLSTSRRAIQPRKCTGAPRALLTCHCEERSDVAISQNTAGQLGSHRQNRNCLPEIATSACGLLAMTNFWSSRFTGSHYGTTVRHGASRTPLPCNAPVLILPAWAGEWSGRSHDPSPPASFLPGYPHCGRARGCGSRCSGTAARPAR